MYINIRILYMNYTGIIHPEKKRSPRDFTSWLCCVDVSSPGTSCTAPALRNSEETKRQCWPVAMETISSTQVRNQRYEWIMKQNLVSNMSVSQLFDFLLEVTWSETCEMKWKLRNIWKSIPSTLDRTNPGLHQRRGRRNGRGYCHWGRSKDWSKDFRSLRCKPPKRCELPPGAKANQFKGRRCKILEKNHKILVFPQVVLNHVLGTRYARCEIWEKP